MEGGKIWIPNGRGTGRGSRDGKEGDVSTTKAVGKTVDANRRRDAE